MQLYSIVTNEYDADLEKLLKRRLARQNMGALPIVSDGRHSALTLGIDTGEELRGLSAALSELMLIDLRHFEIADMVGKLPFPLREKQRILKRALRSALPAAEQTLTRAAEDIRQFLQESELLILEGYLRFRLQEELESWSICVDAAAEELLLEEEYEQLTTLLGLFSALEPGQSGEVLVALNPDGSCTLTGKKENGGEFRIDCAPGSNEGVLDLLSGMAPKRILLYDFSFGKCDKLRNGIELMFGGRVEREE